MTRTTLSAAMSVDAKRVTIASITALAVGSTIKIDKEFMRVLAVPGVATDPIDVIRGVNGSAVEAHPVTAGVEFGLPSEFSPHVVAFNHERAVRSYSATGAIALPVEGQDMVAILNGTVALAMTLANPPVNSDGVILIVVGNGKAAHTVTYTAGWGNVGAAGDVATFDVGAQCALMFIAANGIWVALPSPVSGTLTALDVALA